MQVSDVNCWWIRGAAGQADLTESEEYAHTTTNSLNHNYAKVTTVSAVLSSSRQNDGSSSDLIFDTSETLAGGFVGLLGKKRWDSALISNSFASAPVDKIYAKCSNEHHETNSIWSPNVKVGAFYASAPEQPSILNCNYERFQVPPK